MPIIIAPLNQELTIMKIAASDKEKRHLESLGITVNQKITVLKNDGNVICKVKEGRLALDRELATKIFVSF
ncbi:MAG: ferrous iron transport protein A [Acholeplasmatales bacterium]|nr:ferrous iron transport protein A [Acholeplasmatales bacterium]